MKRLFVVAALIGLSIPAYAQSGGFKITLEVEPLPGPIAAPTASPEAVFGPDDAAALAAAMRRCWAPPIEMMDSGKTSKVLVEFNPDGSVAATTIVSPALPELDKPAMRAVERCGPYTMLPSEAYDRWRQIEVTFDTRDL